MSDTLEKPDARTARLNLLVTEAEKAAIEAKARATGLSVSELLRRAAEGHDPAMDAEALVLLVREVAAMADRVLPKIDAALEDMRALRVTDEDRKRWREEAIEEARQRLATAL